MSDTRQKIEKEIADLFKDVLEYRDSEKFKELLQFCVKLNTLGSYNAMLVKMQCPGAKYVLSRQRWAEYNRRQCPPLDDPGTLWPRLFRLRHLRDGADAGPAGV